MNKRGTGVVFCLIATILFVARYLSAAIYLSGTTYLDYELFHNGLEYVGSGLLIFSIISVIIGSVYLILAEVEDKKSNKK